MVGECDVGEDIKLAEGERSFTGIGSPPQCEGRCLCLGKVGKCALRGAIECQRDGGGDAFDAHGRGFLRGLAEEEDIHFAAGLGIGEEREAGEGMRAVEACDETGFARGGIHVQERLGIIVDGVLPGAIAAAGVGVGDSAFCVDAGHVEGGLVIDEVPEELLHVHGLRAAHDGGGCGRAFAEDIQAVDGRGLGDVGLDEQVFCEFVDALRELAVVDALDWHVLGDERPCLVSGRGVAVAGVERDGAAGGLRGEFKSRDKLRLCKLEQVVLCAGECGPARRDIVIEPRCRGFGGDVALLGRVVEGQRGRVVLAGDVLGEARKRACRGFFRRRCERQGRAGGRDDGEKDGFVHERVWCVFSYSWRS